MWILTCSFSQYIFFIYQLRIGTKSAFEFHNYRSVQISVIWSNFHIKTKPSEIILWARTLAISINIYWICFYVLQIFNLHSIFQFLFSQLKKEQKSLFFLIIWIRMTDCTCIIISKCSIFYCPLSWIETTRNHVTRLILTQGQMCS